MTPYQIPKATVEDAAAIARGPYRHVAHDIPRDRLYSLSMKAAGRVCILAVFRLSICLVFAVWCLEFCFYVASA